MFKEVIGHDSIKDLMSQRLKGDISGTYMFYGPPSVGKRTMAFELIRTLFCTTREDDCSCDSCRLFLKGHPDLLCLGRYEKIKVADIDDLIEFSSLMPCRADYRAVVLDNAHDITYEASNRLLKVLEEPPRKFLFVLVTDNPQMLLPTIRSRYQEYPFEILSREDLTNILWKKLSFDLPQARVLGWIAAESSADVFRKAGQYLTYRNQAFTFISDLRLKRLVDAFDFVDKIGSENMSVFLDMVMLILTDMLSLKYGVAEIANSDIAEDLRKLNERMSQKALIWATSNFSQVKRFERLNVNLSMNMKNVLIRVQPVFVSS